MLQFLHQAHSLLSINALPFAERDMILQNAAAQREAKAQFDKSRLVDLSEHVLLDLPAAQVHTLPSLRVFRIDPFGPPRIMLGPCENACPSTFLSKGAFARPTCDFCVFSFI